MGDYQKQLVYDNRDKRLGKKRVNLQHIFSSVSSPRFSFFVNLHLGVLLCYLHITQNKMLPAPHATKHHFC